jgi:hypothetical protein
MAEQQTKEDTQKTVVSFIVGLLIGGLLVWAFTGSPSDTVVVDTVKSDTKATSTEVKTDTTPAVTKTDTTPAVATLPTGDGAVEVNGQKAGRTVALTSATFPVKEGWVGVRDFEEGKLGGILGVVRFSEAQGLVPTEIILQRPTVSGKAYAIVFFTENGDRSFNLASDVQIDKEFGSFTAQ